MKIALCLFGIIGGKKGQNGAGGAIHPEIGHQSYVDNLMASDDVDVFIHTWSKDWEGELVSLYQPKKILTEEQELFTDVSAANYGFNSFEQLIAPRGHEIVHEARKSNGYTDEQVMQEFEQLIFRSSSRWLSTFKSNQLKSQYEAEQNQKYDFVISSRFDIKLVKKTDFRTLSQDVLYTSYRHNRVDIEDAFYDLMFMGGSALMDVFTALYQHRFNYSIRPTWACKEHCEKFGIKHSDYFEHEVDYRLIRDIR